MSRGPFPALHQNQTWRYALLGGLISIPLVLGDYWLSGMGNTFSINMVFFGGLLAGYLGQKNGADVERAAIGAGVVGGLPGYIWILPAVIRTGTEFATAWSSPPAAALLMGVLGVIMIGISALVGFIGGVVGGWLSKKVDGNHSTTIGT